MFKHMDAHLDTPSDDLCKVNTHCCHIAWRQAQTGGFVASPSPSPEALVDEDADDGIGDDDKDEDASSSSNDEMMTSR